MTRAIRSLFVKSTFWVAMLTVTLSLAFPLIALVVLSVQNRQGLASDAKFIGLRNYIEVIASEEFWRATWLTLQYSVFSVALQIVIGMVAALALRWIGRGRAVVMVICLLPYALPSVVGCLAWRWALSGEDSRLNRLAHATGLFPDAFSWFSEGTAIFTLVIVSAWMFTPFVIIMFFSKLVSIPQVRYEVAAANGLSPAQSFIHVTLYEMRWVILSVLVLRALWMASKFDVVWLLIGREAAGESVRTLPVLAYIKGFQAGWLGYAAALSVLLLIVLLGLTLVAMRFMPREYAR